MIRPTPTPRQAEVYRLIVEGCNDGLCPTMKEMGEAIGVSKVSVYEPVCTLVRHGYIDRTGKFKARNLVPIAPIDFRYTQPVRISQENALALLDAAKSLLDYLTDEDPDWLEDEIDVLRSAVAAAEASDQPTQTSRGAAVASAGSQTRPTPGS